MKGRMNTGLGEIVINPDVIAMYAGSVAVECFGIVGMASVSMKDGLVKLLKKEDDLQVVESVTGGLEASKQTFKYIVQNPQELTKQNEFLYKDLPNIVKLSEKFIEMKKQSVRTEEINRDLDETLLLIKTLSHSISKNYHEILMDDVNVIKHQVDFDK